jgi:hypothetical protein
MVAVCLLAHIRPRHRSLYLFHAGLWPAHSGSTIMSKERNSRREDKKQPLKSTKEKKKDKQTRKQEANPIQPLLKE